MVKRNILVDLRATNIILLISFFLPQMTGLEMRGSYKVRRRGEGEGGRWKEIEGCPIPSRKANFIFKKFLIFLSRLSRNLSFPSIGIFPETIIFIFLYNKNKRTAVSGSSLKMLMTFFYIFINENRGAIFVKELFINY